MASRTATPPRVTGGRPATMTRSVVQQARTQGRPTTPTAGALDIPSGGGEQLTADGWVNVENHKRKHKQGGATGAVAVPSTSVSLASTSATSGRANGREMRRTQSALDATSTTAHDREEPPVARPNARADALSAAVTMDKKARERSYYANTSANSANGATSPPAALSVATTAWGSPPPPPGFASHRSMQRAKSTSPDAAAAALELERGSTLQKLMSAWQLSEDAAEQQAQVGIPRGATARSSNKAARADGSGELIETLDGMFDFSFPDMPPEPTNNALRRTQSDVLPATMSLSTTSNGHRQRSPTGRSPADGKRSNGNTNGNGNSNSNTNGNGNATNQQQQQPSARKCGDKRDFFFRNLDFETRSLLQIDEVASFSVTDFEMAKKISSAIVDLFPEMKAYAEQQAAAEAFFYGFSHQDAPPPVSPMPRKYPLIVTDATACVGGNVLSFCDYFHFVYAIENDPTRVAMLENNLRVLGKSNVACRCASYLDVMYEYHQDVVFFDPPWGGPEYKDQDKVDLYLDEQPLYEICEQLQGYAKCIVLKVPTNFDDEKFAYCVSGRVTVRKDFKKMHLVVLDFR